MRPNYIWAEFVRSLNKHYYTLQFLCQKELQLLVLKYFSRRPKFIYRRCPDLQAAGHGNATQLLRKSDFIRRNGAFVATRARVELVHVRGAWHYGRGNLNACAYCMATPYLAWQPSVTQL